MRYLRRVFGTLYTVWVGIVFISLMLVLLPLFLFYPLLGQRANRWLATVTMLGWFQAFAWLTFIRLRVHGRARSRLLPDGRPARPCVWVGNHSSFLDTPAVKSALGFGFLPLGKREQAKMPVLGWIYRHNVILIDRSSAESRRESMRVMADYLRRGISVMVFPEGTMNRTEHLVKPFYDGAFRLAVAAQVPICPFATVGARQLMPRGSLRVRPGSIHTYFAEPIPTTGLTEADIPALRRRVYEVLDGLLRAHSPAHYTGMDRPLPPPGFEVAVPRRGEAPDA